MAINPIDVEKTLKGLDFPTDKETIVQHARDNGGGDDEIRALEGLPEREYSDPVDIAEALAGETGEKNIEIMDEEDGGSE